MKMYFQPKTPFAALRAATDGLLPPEAFIFKATSIEPISDNPENLQEIERILGQKNRDLETNMRLLDLLGKLIKNPDKEIALFAAESINAIENDYNRKLESLEEDEHRTRAQLYKEMAELNKGVTDLKNFYLREAFSSYRKLEITDKTSNEDILNMSIILIELGLLGQAGKILIDNNLSGIDAKFILADISFRERDYTALYTVIEDLDKQRSMMDINQTALIDFWMGRDE